MDGSKKSCELSPYAMQLIQHTARKLVGTAGFTEDDVEDIEQDLALDLLERLPRFDPARASHNTFVIRLVERKACRLIRDRERERRDPAREACSLSDPIDGRELVETISEDDVDLRTGKYNRPAGERTDLALDVGKAISGLPDELRPIAEALTTMSVAEAARELGIPRWKLYEVYLPQIREVFAAKDLGDYV